MYQKAQGTLKRMLLDEFRDWCGECHACLGRLSSSKGAESGPEEAGSTEPRLQRATHARAGIWLHSGIAKKAPYHPPKVRCFVQKLGPTEMLGDVAQPGTSSRNSANCR